jgi:hypothetical protein
LQRVEGYNEDGNGRNSTKAATKAAIKTATKTAIKDLAVGHATKVLRMSPQIAGYCSRRMR